MKIDLNTSLKNNKHENSLTKTMKTEIQQLQSLVTIVIKMIKNDCPDATSNADGNEACTRAKQIAWTVISILPISMFFALFAIFGGFSRMG